MFGIFDVAEDANRWACFGGLIIEGGKTDAKAPPGEGPEGRVCVWDIRVEVFGYSSSRKAWCPCC